MHAKSFSVRPLRGVFGAEVTGVDLSEPPLPAVSAALAGAVSHYGMLVLPAPRISRRGIEGLMRSFGCVRHASFVNAEVAEEEKGAHPEDCIALMTDPLAASMVPRVAMLYAEGLPLGGAESIWCSRSDAYDGLSPSMQAYLEPLEVLAALPGSEPRPLVPVHSLTGRKHLGIGASFEGRVLGVPREEGELVLELVRNLLSTPENQIRIPWVRGMAALWDCRLAEHYAVGGYAEPGWRLHCISASAPRTDPLTRPLRTV